MSVWARLGAFVVVLLGTFGTAYAVGERMPGHTHSGQSHSHVAPLVPPAFESGNYRLLTDSIVGAKGEPRVITFHLQTIDMEERVTEFQMAHEALLHAVMIRPDLSGYEHFHPTISDRGSWEVTLDQPGPWHLIFDSTPKGESAPIVLSANLDDEVEVEPVPLPDPDDDVVVDGLHLLRNGLNFSIYNEDGTPATGLEPYLGQAAHLVAIRQGDLSYVHLHAMSEMDGMFMFGDTLPQPGTYRLFLQFGHNGTLLTIPFTVAQA